VRQVTLLISGCKLDRNVDQSHQNTNSLQSQEGSSLGREEFSWEDSTIPEVSDYFKGRKKSKGVSKEEASCRGAGEPPIAQRKRKRWS